MLPPGIIFYLVLVGSLATEMADSGPETNGGVSLPSTPASPPYIAEKETFTQETFSTVSFDATAKQTQPVKKQTKNVPFDILKQTFISRDSNYRNLWSKLEEHAKRDYMEDFGALSQNEAEPGKVRKEHFPRPKVTYKKPKLLSAIMNMDDSPYSAMLKAFNLSNNHSNVGDVRVWENHVKHAYPPKLSKLDEISNAIDDLDSQSNHDLSEDYEFDVKDEVKGVVEYKMRGRKLVRKRGGAGPTVAYGKSPADMIGRFRRETADPINIEGPCRSFVESSDQTFYSPGWPSNYPNNTDCVTVLTAEKGYLIKLDFRDEFYIEPSDDCRFDYLEVRDGAHGYSPLIGQFCGKSFPPLLTSKSRYLWLHFHSDDNIEYGGFTAIYDFIPRPTSSSFQPEPEVCRMDLTGFEGVINRSDINPERVEHAVKYGVPLDCMWVITVDKDKKIMLQFNHFKLVKPNDCDSNFVDVFSNRTDIPSRIKNYCGSMADMVESPTNILHIRFMAEPSAINSTFEALFTAYREKGKGNECEEDEYDCEDNTCISNLLKCNHNINCRFKWDEDGCNVATGDGIMGSDHIIIIMVVFSLILFGMSAAFVFNCIKKLISDHRIIQEHIRQSREEDLNEVGDQIKVSEQISKIIMKQDTLSPRSRSASEDLDNTDCYVPGVGEILPIILQGNQRERSNGSLGVPQNASLNNRNNEIIVRQQSIRRQDAETDMYQDDKESESDDQGINDMAGSGIVPEMCDSSCQTRESLFQTPAFSHHGSSDRSFSPVAPPSVDYSTKPTRGRDVYSSESSARQPYLQPESTPFSTFGYSGNTVQRLDSRSLSSRPKDPRYKAEAVIEMNQFGDETNGNTLDNRRFLHNQHFIEDQKNKNRIDLDQSPSHAGRTFIPAESKHFGDHKKHRPYSAETTKSAPDVIIMTKSH